MRFVLGLMLCLLAGGAVAQTPQRAALGVATADLPPNFPVHGAWVRLVSPGSAATAAGLLPNDVIIGIDGRPVQASAVLTTYIGARNPGDTVTLDVLRRNSASPNGVDRFTVTATLGGAVATPHVQPPTATEAPAPPEAASPPTAATDTVKWERFTDPNKHAFSTDVPQGWHVVGGLFRRSPIAASPWVRMLSPDRHTYIVVGDPSISYFATPLSSGANPPSRQGQVVRPYQTGVEFSRDYVTRILPSVCNGVKVKGEKERPDLAQGPWTRANTQATHSGGEVTFTCRLNGADAAGMVVADTYIYGFPGSFVSSYWTVDLHAGFVATLDRLRDALDQTIHVVSAFRMNPDWVHQQQAVIDATTRAINANTAAMAQWSQQQIATAQNQMHAMSQQSEAFDRILTSSSPYSDGAGHTFNLDNTKTQWLGPGGRTFGTTGASPGPGWQRLQEVAPE